jgi:hypothetical protein
MTAAGNPTRAHTGNTFPHGAPAGRMNSGPAAHHTTEPLRTVPTSAQKPIATRKKETPKVATHVNGTAKTEAISTSTIIAPAKAGDEKAHAVSTKDETLSARSGKATVFTTACWVPEKTDINGTKANVSITVINHANNPLQGFLKLELEKTGEVIAKNLLEFESSFASRTLIMLSFSKDGTKTTRVTYCIDFATQNDRDSFRDSLLRHRDAVVTSNETCSALVRSRASKVETGGTKNGVSASDNDKKHVTEEAVPAANGTKGANGISTSVNNRKLPSEAAVVTHSALRPTPPINGTNASPNTTTGIKESEDLIDVNSGVPVKSTPANGMCSDSRAPTEAPTSFVSQGIQLPMLSELEANMQVASLGEFNTKVEIISNMWAVVCHAVVTPKTNLDALEFTRQGLFTAAVKKQAKDKQERVMLLKAVLAKTDGQGVLGTDGKVNGKTNATSTPKGERVQYTPDQISNLQHRATSRPAELDKATFLPPAQGVQIRGEINSLRSSPKAPVGTVYTTGRPSMNDGQGLLQQEYRLKADEALAKHLQEEESRKRLNSEADEALARCLQEEENAKGFKDTGKDAHTEGSKMRSAKQAAASHVDWLFEKPGFR